MATNMVNGKQYVGQTINSLKQRKREHINASNKNKAKIYFHSAIRKYGKDKFGWEILHNNITNIDFLNRLEIFYIGYYNTFLGEGYNLIVGGRNATPSKETRKKLSMLAKGKNNPNYGNKGIRRSPRTEFKKGMISWNKGKKYPGTGLGGKDNSMYGRCGKDSPVAKPLIIDDIYFYTVYMAAKYFGVHTDTIRNRVRHKTKWLDHKYIDNVEVMPLSE